MYASQVVMRIPAYNGDFEEPWFWADYGDDIFTYSFFTDKYQTTKDPEDLAKAQAARGRIPNNAFSEFIWRRERNFNVTTYVLNSLAASKKDYQIFRKLYITLDDNAPYGFNIAEANKLRALVT